MGKRTAKRKEAAGGTSRRETRPGNFICGCSTGGHYLVSGSPLPSNNLHGVTLKYYTEVVLYLNWILKYLFIYCGRVRICVCVCVCVCLTAVFSRSIIHPQILGELTKRNVGNVTNREKHKHLKIFATKPTWNALGSNPRLRVNNATNRFRYGTVWYWL